MNLRHLCFVHIHLMWNTGQIILQFFWNLFYLFQFHFFSPQKIIGNKDIYQESLLKSTYFVRKKWLQQFFTYLLHVMMVYHWYNENFWHVDGTMNLRFITTLIIDCNKNHKDFSFFGVFGSLQLKWVQSVIFGEIFHSSWW